MKADIEAGRAGKVVRELEPFSGRHKAVENCCRYLRNNIERMQYDRYRDRGMQVGSGVVEGGCRPVRAAAQALRNALVGERRHEPQGDRLPRLAGESGHRSVTNNLGYTPCAPRSLMLNDRQSSIRHPPAPFGDFGERAGCCPRSIKDRTV